MTTLLLPKPITDTPSQRETGAVSLVLDDSADQLLATLRKGEAVLVGRHTSSDVVLADGAVSRHATLLLDEDGLRVHDDHSTNGTWVNARRVVSSRLLPGDVVRFGSTSIAVRRPRAGTGQVPVAEGAPAPSAQDLSDTVVLSSSFDRA